MWYGGHKIYIIAPSILCYGALLFNFVGQQKKNKLKVKCQFFVYMKDYGMKCRNLKCLIGFFYIPTMDQPSKGLLICAPYIEPFLQ